LRLRTIKIRKAKLRAGRLFVVYLEGEQKCRGRARTGGPHGRPAAAS
jgi:hypothetical protein